MKSPSNSVHYSALGLVMVLALALMVGCGSKAETKKDPTGPLTVHVGGTMLPAIEELARQYEAQTGQKVEINSGGSGELLAHIELQKEGDLYVCHDPFLDMLMNKFNMGVDGWCVAELTPVIVVQKGNPKGIKGVADLARDDVRLILTDYKLSTLGRMLGTIFSKAGVDLEKLKEKKEIVTNKSGGYSANAVKMNNFDASMVWNAVAYLRSDSLDTIDITQYLPEPGVDSVTSATNRKYFLTPVKVTVATLKCSKMLKEATAFAEYLASEKATKVFESLGYTMHKSEKLYTDGKPGRRASVVLDKKVVLNLYAGAGLRRGMKEVIAAFTEETGISVNPDYGGSGIILATAQSSTDGDLFMPGDVWYVDELQNKAGLIESKTPVSFFVPTLIVQKGNPKNITTLKDLLRDDVSVALGRADACQVGRITGEILALNGVDRAKLKPKESLTVNELGTWVQMTDVDASIVWDAIASNIAKDIEAIEIPKDKNIISTIEIGLMTTSKHKNEAQAFIDFVSGVKGQAILKELDYRVDAP